MHCNIHEDPNGPREKREPWEVHDQDMGELAAKAREDSFRRLPEMERDYERSRRHTT